MINLELRRFLNSGHATVGALIAAEGVLCFTVENPWLDNQPGLSCIPCGTFVATSVVSPKFGPTFDVDVPNRSLIRFHPGNTVADSRGCILVVSAVMGYRGLGSRSAFRAFLDRLKGVSQFRLTVKSVS